MVEVTVDHGSERGADAFRQGKANMRTEHDLDRHLVTVDELFVLRRSHPAWRLLVADHAPVIIALLDRAFMATGERQLPAASAAFNACRVARTIDAGR